MPKNFHLCLFVLCSAVLFLTVDGLHGGIIISEVMFDAAGSDYHDEFIEVYNVSEHEEVSLNGWLLKIDGAEDRIQSLDGNWILGPGHFAVILDYSYKDNSNAYAEKIPDSVLVFYTVDKAFGKSGLPNSKTAMIELLNKASFLVDRYGYSVDNEPGFSDEKILLTGDNDADNWGNCLITGGTPGIINSISPRDYDLAVNSDKVRFSPDPDIAVSGTWTAEMNIGNAGLFPFEGEIETRLFIDQNHDSIFNQTDQMIINRSDRYYLSLTDSLVIREKFVPNSAGSFQCVGSIAPIGDMNKKNNTVIKKLIIPEYSKTICINEIKFLTLPGEEEWIELKNYGNEPLCLQGWGLSDEFDTCRIDSPVIIQPGGYKIIMSGTERIDLPPEVYSDILQLRNFPVLNNQGDNISLLHPVFGCLEKLFYEQEWLENEAWRSPSLERIHHTLAVEHSSSWGPCMSDESSTPAMENSIHTGIKPPHENIRISPNPFSPDGDGFQDHAVISVVSSIRTGRLRARIFDISGRKLGMIQDNRFFSSGFSFAWNGLDGDGRPLDMGIYIIFIEILDDRKGILKEFKSTITLARPL